MREAAACRVCFYLVRTDFSSTVEEGGRRGYYAINSAKKSPMAEASCGTAVALSMTVETHRPKKGAHNGRQT